MFPALQHSIYLCVCVCDVRTWWKDVCSEVERQHRTRSFCLSLMYRRFSPLLLFHGQSRWSLGGESLHEWEGISFIVDPGYLIHLTSCSQDSFITKPIKTSNRIKGRPADANIYRGDCDIQWGGYTVNIITQTKMFFYGKLYVYFYSIWGLQLYFLKKSLYPKTIKNIVISQKRHFQAFHPQPAVSLRRLHVCWIKYLITWPTD